MLTAFVDEPARVTPAQMDRWCRDFDNWGICDTVCFCLWDRTPHAWAKVVAVERSAGRVHQTAAFALLASLAGHDKKAADSQFLECLPLIERAATDERNFVKKGVSWALRRIGRRNAALNAAAVEVSCRMAESDVAGSAITGKEALRELTSPLVRRKLAAKDRRHRKGPMRPIPITELKLKGVPMTTRIRNPGEVAGSTG